MRDDIASATHLQLLGEALRRSGYTTHPQYRGYALPVECGFETVYIHVYPWSRGYSIYVSPDITDGSPDWRYAPEPYKHMQHPLYTARDVVGAYHVPIKAILYAVDAVAARVNDLHTHRTSQHNADLKRANISFERALNERIQKSGSRP